MPTIEHPNASGIQLHEDKRIKEPVRAASIATVTLATPGTTLDGVTLASGNRVLLKDQTTTSQNGIYVWTGASSTLTRTTDADDNADWVYGYQVYVREGTTNATTIWVYSQSAAVSIGTTALTFAQLFVGSALSDPTSTRGDLITRGVSALVRLAIGTVGQFLGSDGTDALWTNTARYFGTSGLTGATAPARFVGGTASGAPISGTFAVGDFVIDATGKVWICTGAGSPGTWTQPATGLSNPMTTTQDLIVGGTSGAPARLGIGANTQVLSIVAGLIAWANPSSGFSNPMNSIGDMMTGTTAGTAIRLPIGAGGQVLTVVGGQPGWANPAGGGGGGSSVNTASALYLSQHYL